MPTTWARPTRYNYAHLGKVLSKTDVRVKIRECNLSSTEIQLTVPGSLDMAKIVGVGDEILREIEDNFSAQITVRGNLVHLKGKAEEVQTLTSLFSDMIKMVESGETPSKSYVSHAIKLIQDQEFSPNVLRDDILLTYRGRAIRPKTAGQKKYADAIKKNTLTFGIGPAGTGKTYLAMAMAVGALKRKEVGRIVLTRPVVEAGESLGFLPGTLQEKVDPYVRPLYDALFDMTDMEKGNSLIESGVIEIAPLAYMRGRTLNDAFVILDEAQNTTPEQMKMFLTRMGFNSKFVVTGDITQLDLPHGVSGLKTIKDILEGIEGVAFCEMSASDVVRHSLVAKIVDAYKKYEEASEPKRAKRSFRRAHSEEESLD